MNDWNGDGREDWADVYFVHENFLKDGNDHESSGGGNRGNGLSTIGITLCLFSGIAEQALIYTAFGIDVENVPVIVMIILWVVFSTATAWIVISIKSKLF